MLPEAWTEVTVDFTYSSLHKGDSLNRVGTVETSLLGSRPQHGKTSPKRTYFKLVDRNSRVTTDICLFLVYLRDEKCIQRFSMET